MNRVSFPAPGSQLDTLAQEILQWNRQINLVTRVDTTRQLDSLLQHCCQAWNMVQAELEEDPHFAPATYLDLGSGAGLPGLVWSLARQALGHRGQDVLVEPRTKRAWFLRRTARRLGLERVLVSEGRWGEEVLPGVCLSPEKVFVSLKALKLEDREVLQGLQDALGDLYPPAEVCIFRFLGPIAGTTQDGDGGLPGRGADRQAPPYPSTRTEGMVLVHERILGLANPRLEWTRYRRRG